MWLDWGCNLRDGVTGGRCTGKEVVSQGKEEAALRWGYFGSLFDFIGTCSRVPEREEACRFHGYLDTTCKTRVSPLCM